MNPKTIRGFLSMMLKIADFDIYSLKGYDDLSDKEQYEIGAMIAGIQNDLGEDMEQVLHKFNLKWKG